MFIPVTQPPPSKAARELGEKLFELIQIYKESQPRLSLEEIRTALGLAERRAASEMGGSKKKTRILLGLLIGNALVGGAMAFYFAEHGVQGAQIYLVLGLIVFFMVVVACLAFIKAR